MNARLAALTLLALLAGGCGYRPTLGDGEYRRDVRTIAVITAASVDDDTDTPGDATASVVRMIEAKTPYRVAPSEIADTMLEIVITGAGVGTGRRSDITGLPDAAGFGIRADVTWTDLRTGEVLLELGGVQGSGNQFPTLGEGLPTAKRAAAEDLGQKVAEELAARW